MSMNIMLIGAGGGGGQWDGPSMGGNPTVHTWGSYESYAWRTVGSHTVSYTHLTLPTTPYV